MTGKTNTIQHKEADVTRRLIVAALAAVAIVALSVAPAFAEGYNESGQYTRANGYFAGPHGGYTTTTNKCSVCHSTHYAQGSYMLLRANSREAACDYCHGGGGGSTINIMMDNDYKASADASAGAGDGVAITDAGMGLGTGHTLGSTLKAPGDIEPAYSDPNGFACFDCHSPHGNSARILTTFSNPGRAFAAPGQEGRPTTAQLNGSSPTANWLITAGFSGDKDGLLEDGEWGIDRVYGNFVWDGNATAGQFTLAYRPIWPSGRFLLLKDPHSTALEGHADTETASIGTTATGGINKYKINWTDPMGPADSGYGGYQDNDSNKKFPFANVGPDGTPGNGFLAESEFCTDCHDGTAGASTQAAEVWNAPENDYTVAYSHDAQPRH